MVCSRRDSVLSAADYFLALFVVFPVLCVYWRGSWDLISSTVFPGQEPFCYWVHTAVGSANVFSYYILPALHNCITRDRKILYAVGSRLFMIYHGILYMSLWRGVWGLADFYITRGWGWSLVALAPTLILMLLLRIVRQTMWPPYVVVADSGADVFMAANRFRTTPEKPIRYFLDSTFTCLFANALAIFAWRTIWCVYDGLVLPDDPWWSDLASLIAGVVTVLFFFAIHGILATISQRLERSGRFLCRLFWEWVIYCLVFASLTSIWRGAWNLNIRYLISDPLVGGLTNHLTGTALLLLLNVYSLVGCCGCAVDGSDKDGTAFFPVQFVSLYYAKGARVNENEESKEEHLLEDSKTHPASTSERAKAELILHDSDEPRSLIDQQKTAIRETTGRLSPNTRYPGVKGESPYRDPRRTGSFLGDQAPIRIVRTRTPLLPPRKVVNSPHQPGHNLHFGDPWVLRSDLEHSDSEDNLSFC